MMWKEWIKGMFGKETSHIKTEIGHDADGEVSLNELQKWFRWSAAALVICFLAVGVMAAVSSVRSRKEAVIMEVDSGITVEIFLNRKGTVLKEKGDAANIKQDYSLEDGMEMMLQGFLDHGQLGTDGAVIITLRPAENGVAADMERIAEDIHVYAEAFLRKKHSDGKVYVQVLEDSENVKVLAESSEISLGKASLILDLMEENLSLHSLDKERFLKMSIEEISAEITERKFKTSFIVVVAKQVYAHLLDIEEEPEEITEAVEATTEAVKETKPAKKPEAKPTEAATVPETSVTENPRQSEETAKPEDETSEETTAESSESYIEETVQETTEAYIEETEAEPTQVPEPETSVAIEPETSAAVEPETSAAVEPETSAAEPEPTAAAVPETNVPKEPAPGILVEQVIPLTPVG